MTHALLSRAGMKPSKEPYGDVAYADPGHQADGKKRYPVDTPEHVRAAWSYISQDSNASKYTAEQLASVKAAIRKAADKLGVELSADTPRSSTLDVCVRSYAFEWDERAKGDGRTLEGYAAVFNSPTRIRDLSGDFDEVILPGAFTRSLRERTPILQWDHGKDPRVGTVPIGAIHDLAEDSRGLHVRARLFDNQVVEPVRQAIEARAVRGMSFRFGVPKQGATWTRRAGDVDLRGVRDADVHELGPVAFPAYDDTSVSVRDVLADLHRLDPADRQALAREIAAELRRLNDFGGRDGTRSAPGAGPGAEPDRTTAQPHLRQRLDDGALRARGILL